MRRSEKIRMFRVYGGTLCPRCSGEKRECSWVCRTCEEGAPRWHGWLIRAACNLHLFLIKRLSWGRALERHWTDYLL